MGIQVFHAVCMAFMPIGLSKGELSAPLKDL